MQALPPSLQRWHEYPQFILCDGKVPIANWQDPANWMTAEEACALSEQRGLGVGFVFTESDPFFFIDVDKCVEDGQWNDVANTIIGMFPGAAIEVSTSGTGLHVFGVAHVPPHSNKNAEFRTEFYTEGRYALLTGNELQQGDVWLDWTATIEPLAQQWFPERQATAVEWSNGPTDPNHTPIESDDVLIAKMLQQMRFGGRAAPADLWYNNEPVLAQNYPVINPESDDPYDRSSADAALANHLAFWTGKDHTRMWNLMFRSALRRDKWEREDYLIRTITNAVNMTQTTYNNQRQGSSEVNDSTPEMNAETRMTEGGRFLSAHQQLEHFKDCYYIRRSHRILTPDGSMLKPEQFKAQYGGWTYSMDPQNERTTRNAWEAFTESQAVEFPKVHGTIFDPLLPDHQIVEENGFKLVNNYVKLDIPRIQGDVTLFLNHMEKLFPNETDRTIILSYMAAIVQYQGVKFQWCPVIQGTEGNGKTLINRCIQAAVGARYCHYPNAADLAGGGLKFNGWIENAVFIAIEEMYTGSARFDLMDAMKPIITNDQLEIQRKGQDQYTGRVVANFILNTNHKDAIKITYDQRRYWMNYTAQQSQADLIRDGMNEHYFARLYDWLKKEDGYAMVAEFLYTYPIPEQYNPAGVCQRAPVSSSTAEAIYASLGPVEQHILEAVADERQGFRGGYISTKAVANMLKEIGQNRLSPRAIGEMIKDCGYVKHPGLPDGRLTSTVLQEGGKPRLYLDSSQKFEVGLSPVQIKADYESKQGYVNPGVQS